MAEAVVSIVVETLGNLLIEEAQFLHGVSEQVEQLQLELNQMRSFLRDADARQHDEERIKVCISQARDLAYEAEDLLERYAFRAAYNRGGGCNATRNTLKRCVCILKECYASHELGSQVQTLKSKASDLTRRFHDYGIGSIMQREGSSSSSSVIHQFRRTYSHVVDDDFVGLGSELEMLVQRLIQENQMVVSIYGMGGSGKSTLARKVYNHTEVKRYFDSFSWVCISQQWQTKDILQGILVGLTRQDKKKVEKLREEELVRELFQFQQNRRCLVVLDDIWSTDAWECIKQAFPMKNNGSKILLTTRKREVALHIGRSGFHHQIRLLSDDESWKLLQMKAFKETPHQGHEEKDQMTELGKKMVKSCAGLPLAVVILGGILVKKKRLEEWNAVYSNIEAYLGRGDSVVEQKGEVHKILALSYDDLPHKLKPCFLYLGRFEEDSDIDMETVYQLWIAEGMISMKDRINNQESMMDVAERYFIELVQRCMVQVKASNDDENMPNAHVTRFQSCRLHDLMRDLCLRKAEEENFCLYHQSRDETDQDEMLKYSSSFVSSTQQVYRLIIRVSKIFEHVPLEKRRTRHLRSLTVAFPDVYTGSFPRAINATLNRFTMLRVLVIVNLSARRDTTRWYKKCSCFDRPLNSFFLAIDALKFFKLSKAIGKLIHLRYLSISNSNIFWFSASIGNLLHLQTLDLRQNFVSRLPNMLWKMNGLMHLYLPSIYSSRMGNFKLRLDKLIHLRILENFSNVYCCAKDLYKLTNLQILSVFARLDSSAAGSQTEIIDYILKSKTLRRTSLTLKFFSDSSVEKEKFSSIVGQCLSSCKIHELLICGLVSNLPKFSEANLVDSILVDLEIFSSEMEEDPMMLLEKLPNLRRLAMYSSNVGKEMQCHPSGFPELRSLSLYLFELEKLRIDEGAMPKLSTLSIQCPNLEMIPDGLKSITTLQELHMFRMPKEFTDRIQKGKDDEEEGVDFHKIRHIPSVVF